MQEMWKAKRPHPDYSFFINHLTHNILGLGYKDN